MLRLHFDTCQNMPVEVRQKIEALKKSSSARGGRKQYWQESAKRLGLIDTPHGIYFSRNPSDPLPPLSSTNDVYLSSSGKKRKNSISRAVSDGSVPPATDTALNSIMRKRLKNSSSVDDDASAESVTPDPISLGYLPEDQIYPLVLPEDKDLISDYLYLTLEQMQPCNLMEADQVGCYKGREVGFPGLACKHCVGQAGCGRYFPASEASLSQTTTSQTILNHVRNCRRCPTEIKDRLEEMKAAKSGGKKGDKPKHGGRKVFFHRLWCRIQRIDNSEEEDTVPGSNTKKIHHSGRKSKFTPKKKKSYSNGRSSRTLSFEVSDSEFEGDSTEEENSSTTSSSSFGSQTEYEHNKDFYGEEKTKISEREQEEEDSIISDIDSNLTIEVDGVSLSKSDDIHWLPKLHRYIRVHMIEAFTATSEDQSSSHDVVVKGQAGIRCVFCARKNHQNHTILDYARFPANLAELQNSSNELASTHLRECDSIPENIKSKFLSLYANGTNHASSMDDATVQYWIDSSKELGLINSNEGNGIVFKRDPYTVSPADMLKRYMRGKPILQHQNGLRPGGDQSRYGLFTKHLTKSSSMKNALIRMEDKGQVTDFICLLLLQVKPCFFQESDRRKGTGSHRRDREIGYPGLGCIHCAATSNQGRYFPFSPKSLSDNISQAMHSHMQTCPACPEPIKSSLSFLSHRSLVQKTKMKCGWKRLFYKKIWDRLYENNSHMLKQKSPTQRNAIENNRRGTGVVDEDKQGSDSPNKEEFRLTHTRKKYSFDYQDSDREDGSDDNVMDYDNSAVEPSHGLGDEIINAAALWLWENDHSASVSHDYKSSRGKSKGGRSLLKRKRESRNRVQRAMMNA